MKLACLSLALGPLLHPVKDGLPDVLRGVFPDNHANVAGIRLQNIGMG
jgi:hypothetical protein